MSDVDIYMCRMWILFMCIRYGCLCMSDVDIIYVLDAIYVCYMWIFICVRCGCLHMSDVDSIYVCQMWIVFTFVRC